MNTEKATEAPRRLTLTVDLDVELGDAFLVAGAAAPDSEAALLGAVADFLRGAIHVRWSGADVHPGAFRILPDLEVRPAAQRGLGGLQSRRRRESGGW